MSNISFARGSAVESSIALTEESARERSPGESFPIRAGAILTALAAEVRNRRLFESMAHKLRPSQAPVKSNDQVPTNVLRLGNTLVSSELQFPSLAEYRLHIFISFWTVGESHIPAVPVKLPGHPECDYTKQHPFRERRGNTKVGASGITAFASANPVGHVSWGPCQQLRG